MIAQKDFPSLAVPGHNSGGCNLEGASWRREEVSERAGYTAGENHTHTHTHNHEQGTR